AVDNTVSALIVEPVRGEAGVRPLPEGWLRRARQLTREHGALLIVDEAQALPIDSLEELRMLSNFQAGGHALLQILLLGQPE
ncbi:aminotransferase class III-fold pyridoxal phosphate-dependent enzyme, partial [Rhizobium johnstonii]